MVANLECDSLRVDLSSFGNLRIRAGRLQRQVVTNRSLGEYLASDVPSAEADVMLTSSGMATLRVSGHMRGSLSSNGDIYCFGNPEVAMNTSSSARRMRVGDRRTAMKAVRSGCFCPG